MLYLCILFQGVFVVMAGGLAGALLVWCAELLISTAKNKASL